jgi:streptogramin lyase
VQYVVVTPSGAASLYTVDNDVNPIYSMVLGPDGLVWFSQSDLLGTISPGQRVQTYQMPQQSPHVNSITVGGDRNIWFADYVNNLVGKINPRTKSITVYPVSGTICTSPSQIIWSADIWFSCHQGSTSMLVEMTTTGTIVGAFASPVTIVAITPGLSRQTVWFLGEGTDRGGDTRWSVNRMNSSGVTQTYKQPNPNDNDFEVPIDIVVGPDGNQWFTQETPNAIAKFTRP